ncbi:MAG TPA: DUF3237 family protein [Vicinamibacterales bacterium]|nr:DUF3237 family protein [Vicinamibacterales bacterium]
MTHARAIAGIIGVLLSVISMSVGVAGQGDAPGADLIVPHESWSCGLPGGIPRPEGGTLVFEAEMKLDRVADIGRTQYGRRQVAVVQGGTLSGTRVNGSVMTGALDFELTLATGVIEVEQIYVLRTGDGRYVYLRAAGTGADAKDVRLVMDFEAPTASDVAWLNTGTYVGRRVLNAAARTMTLRVYDVSGTKPASGSARVVRITKPAGVPPQPWDYRTAAPSEKRGNQLITEIVTLSPSQSVGPSKRGPRNIIPITGGDLTGRITGKVLPGGADYQNLSPPATIDARYLWQTADGEIIIVRNGGAFGSLVPTFEVRVDSPYAWLNTGTYLSSNPEMRQGGVGLTFFDSTR